MCVAGGLNSMVWLTLISHFVLLCHIVGSKKKPQKEKTSCPFLLRQYQGVQANEPCCSHLPTAAQTPAGPLFAFPFGCGNVQLKNSFLCSWGLFKDSECYKLVLVEMADPSWQLWWLSPCHATWHAGSWCSVILVMKLSQALRMPKSSCLLSSARWKFPGFLFLHAAPRD